MSSDRTTVHGRPDRTPSQDLLITQPTTLQNSSTVVILVEPSGPLNVGSVARLCANFDVQHLRLVSPRCDHLSRAALQMAVHGDAVLKTATIHPDLLSAISDCRRTVGSCGRIDHGGIPLHLPDQAIRWLLEPACEKGSDSVAPQAPVALVFGREDRGLSNDELRLCQRVLTLRSGQTYPSLNLSHAVAVVLHELALQKAADRNLSAMEETTLDPARADALLAMLDDAKDLLLEAGFLLQHTASARMAKVSDLLQRAAVRSGEVALLRGMVRQLRWAIRAKRS